MAAHAKKVARIRGSHDFEEKLNRLRNGGSLRVIDLFAGCGGLSLGFHSAGYQIAGAVEYDPKAAKSHALNFFGEQHPDFCLHAKPHDITKFSPAEFCRSILRVKRPDNQIDVIVGGPPCQAFARIGRAKLREIMEDPKAHLRDSRASLYIQYLKYVAYFRPLAVLMENVPEIISFDGNNIAEDIVVSLQELGYRCRYTILNAAHYGVPQLRQRFYLVAILDSLDVTPSFPCPSHQIELPEGYSDARQAVLKDLFNHYPNNEKGPTHHYIDPPAPAANLGNAITVLEALKDLPILLSKDIPSGVRRFNKVANYRQLTDLCAYARQMRTWPDFVAGTGVVDHVTRRLPRDYRIFKSMRPGDEYPRAHRIALRYFREALRRHKKRTGKLPHPNSKVFRGLRKFYVPPYDVSKFPNKWCKIDPALPTRTLTAHIGKDTYTHIHYDSKQSRVITVREAARLQSFPDGFRFEGPMNSAFRQIGNAVPPLMAATLARHLREMLEGAARCLLPNAKKSK